MGSASRHASKKLYKQIDEISELANKRKGVPNVELAPFEYLSLVYSREEKRYRVSQ